MLSQAICGSVPHTPDRALPEGKRSDLSRVAIIKAAFGAKTTGAQVRSAPGVKILMFPRSIWVSMVSYSYKQSSPPECFQMSNQRSIIKVYTKVKLQEEKSDFEYWQTQPAEKRLATLEQIRFEYHAWNYDSQPRLQRVLSITKRK